MAESLTLVKFSDVELDDPFFDSLKAQYEEFTRWFISKNDQLVYILRNDEGLLQGFVYLKIEDGVVDDIDPPLAAARRLKVGTLKIVAHGTRLGERALKKIFDHALKDDVDEVYVTVFDSHAGLINLFKKYGFIEKGNKVTRNGTEIVLLRSMERKVDDIILDYPYIKTEGVSKFLLAVYPEYHTKLFPDSILNTEDSEIISDVSYTNTIHKVYIAKLYLTRMKRGDIVVIYRTTDIPGRARFRSVVTSLCVVEETRARRDFVDVNNFLAFALPHSVFPEDELRSLYAAGDRLYAVRMTYNAAFRKRTIRGRLLDEVGISENPRWDLRLLTDGQFQKIVELGSLDENIIVD
ncbi:MAG TPA: N-acetyltransferase [Ancylobacter sp.]